MRASDKLEKAKRVDSTPALQNGGHGYPKRTVEDKQLDGKNRPQGCILYHPNASHSPTFSKVYGKSTALPVYMSPIQLDCLHRQHTCDGGVPRTGEGLPGGINLSIVRLGDYHQHTEVDHNPSSMNRISGIAGRLDHFIPKSPGEKLHHIRSEIDQITKKSSPITAKQLAQIIGKLHAASQAVLPAPLFYRSLQGDL